MRDAFAAELLKLAREDHNIELLTGDLGFGVLRPFKTELPDQFHNVGIAEQLLIEMATGMALAGKKVVCYSIGNFPVFRCLEQIRNDAAYSGANVKIIAIGGGYTYGGLGMATLYQNAACTLIVSKVESFSMPAAESLCCGTPIAGFKAGGPESFADAQFSEFVNVNDLGGLVSAIVRLARHKVPQNAACIFEPKFTAEQYLKLYQ